MEETFGNNWALAAKETPPSGRTGADNGNAVARYYVRVKRILTCLVFLNRRACECGLYRRCCSRSLARVDADGGGQDSTIEYLLLLPVVVPVPLLLPLPRVADTAVVAVPSASTAVSQPPRSWFALGMTTVSAEQLDRLLLDRRSNRNIIRQIHPAGEDVGGGAPPQQADLIGERRGVRNQMIVPAARSTRFARGTKAGIKKIGLFLLTVIRSRYSCTMYYAKHCAGVNLRKAVCDARRRCASRWWQMMRNSKQYVCRNRCISVRRGAQKYDLRREKRIDR